MTDERLKELIPDVEYAVDHKSMIRMYKPNVIEQQTENLRMAVSVLIKTVEEYKQSGWGYSEERMNYWIGTIERITGKKYEDI